MRNVIKVLLLMTIVLVSACESEQKRSNKATGMLSLQLVASRDVINTTTRTEGDSSGNEGDNTEEDDLVPNVGDFTIALMDGNVVKTSWDKFSEYPKYAVLPVGTYVLKAYYGSSDKEGFESSYYEGTQEIAIEDDATVEANITCYLTNVKVTVEYTDAFKKYFSDYTTTVQSASGSPVVFLKDEVRAAYIKPGAITVYANVKKQNGQSAKLNVLDIDEAKAREFYRLKLDVDAGSATLKISFDDTTVEKPIEINVSDDILNMQPPFFTASGYSSGEMQEVKEGSSISPLSMLITARNGIKKCVLTTQSTSLLAQGWPTSIDLVNPKGEDLEKMKTLGLSMRGLSANVDKMATLDFSEVIPNLQYINGDNENIFSIVVTDKIGRVDEQEEIIKVKALDNQFAVGAVDNVDLGLYEITIPVTLDGDISKVKFQYLNNKVWTNINASNIISEDINHKVTLLLPSMTTTNFQVKVICGSRSLFASVGVNPPAFILQASDADMWATKATIHVVGKNEGTTEYMKTQPVVIEYIKYSEFETGEWITPEQTKNGDVIEITGLPEDAEKKNIYRLKAMSGDMWAANILDITTERAAQIPNSGFEEWSEEMVHKASGITGKKDIYVFYPYLLANIDKWWDTSNLTTTQSRTTTWYYASYPGIVPTAKSSWTASKHLNDRDGKSFKIEAHRGNNAMEIATVGWGSNSWSIFGTNTQEVTPGSLYLGTYNSDSHKEVFGKEFTSRPMSVTFYYKYYSYNNEYTKPYAAIYDVDGNQVGYGDILIDSSTENYTEATINIHYEDTHKKAATFTIVFLSTTVDNPLTKAVQGSSGPFGGYGDSRHIGSVLTIDDVKLIY